MAYGTVVDPVAGTVITVSYAVTNILDPIRWLRLLTGNSDPPGSNYVVVSTSTTGTSWQKIPADALATGAALGNIVDATITAAKLAVGAVVAHLGYTPANKAGDAFSGSISVAGNAAISNTLTALGAVIGNNGLIVGSAGADINGPLTPDSYGGGSTSTGTPKFRGVEVGNDGILVGTGGVAASGPVSGTDLTASGTLSGATINGGSTAAGTVQAKGFVGGTDGAAFGGAITVSGSVSPSSYAGGSTAAGIPSFLGINVGASGIASGAGITVGGVALSRIVKGTYTGNGATSARQITTGFAAKAVFIQNAIGTAAYLLLDGTNGVFLNQALGVQFQATFHLHASDGFVVGDGTAAANVAATDYTYIAVG